MKRALLIGIDTYDQFNGLGGCVNDVRALNPLLSRNYDNSPNFACRVLDSDADRIDRGTLIDAIGELLAPGADVALLYFAGHGSPNASGSDVFLVTQDATRIDDGVPLSDVLSRIRDSKVREVDIILDCCFAGGAGGAPQLGSGLAIMRDGVSILAATRNDQTAAETPDGRGAFSFYLCGALDGGAADILGQVNIAGVYAYLSESFGPWDQRPTFKANIERLHELRVCSPAVPVELLRRLPELFPDPTSEFPLNPSFEPTAEPRHPENEAIFAILQRCRAAKLVEPVNEEHMYFASMNSTACRLTPLGKHYRQMVVKGRL